MHAGLIDEAKACAVLGVSPKTLARWERDNQAPAVVVRLLRLFCGELGALSPAWQGWRLAGDRIYPPGDSRGWAAGFVLALPLRNDQVREQRRTIERLQADQRRLRLFLGLRLGWGAAAVLGAAGSVRLPAQSATVSAMNARISVEAVVPRLVAIRWKAALSSPSTRTGSVSRFMSGSDCIYTQASTVRHRGLFVYTWVPGARVPCFSMDKPRGEPPTPARLGRFATLGAEGVTGGRTRDGPAAMQPAIRARGLRLTTARPPLWGTGKPPAVDGPWTAAGDACAPLGHRAASAPYPRASGGREGRHGVDARGVPAPPGLSRQAHEMHTACTRHVHAVESRYTLCEVIEADVSEADELASGFVHSFHDTGIDLAAPSILQGRSQNHDRSLLAAPSGAAKPHRCLRTVRRKHAHLGTLGIWSSTNAQGSRSTSDAARW